MLGPRLLITTACMCALTTTTANSAEAQSFNFRGAAGLKLDVEYTRFDARDQLSAPSDMLVGGIDLWGTIGTTVQFMAAIDVHLGGALHGGFAYEADLYPFGIGITAGSFAFLGVATGIGVNGVTGEIPFALQIPTRALLQLNVHRRLQLEGFAAGKLISKSGAREGGAESIGGFDEIKAGVLIRIGKGGQNAYQRWGNGYFVGATYSELLGVRSFGAMFGYSISLAYDMGGRWRKPHRPNRRRTKPNNKTEPVERTPTVTPDEL